jgi:ornithine cyclodeaminase
VLILSKAEVEELLDLDALVDAVAAALADVSSGRASMPPRVAALVDERQAGLFAMPAYLPSAGALTTKLVSLFPQNRDRETHQAVIVAFDPENGTPLALMDGTHITASRTAAGSALSARLLARGDARTVAIIGTGVQARSHARALARDPRVERMIVAGRDREAAERLASELRPRLARTIEVADSIESAVRSADIVATATHTDTPVVRRDWLRPGTHVSSVGYNTAGEGEIDGETIRDAVVFVESRVSALAPAPAGAVELTHAIANGLIAPEHVRGELGELVAGTVTGRSNDDEITLYKSVGIAVEDSAAAALVLKAATERGVGTTVEI